MCDRCAASEGGIMIGCAGRDLDPGHPYPDDQIGAQVCAACYETIMGRAPSLEED